MVGSVVSRLTKTLFGAAPAALDFPPPYTGMIAINSDVECTSWSTQLNLLASFAERDLEASFSYWCFGDERMTWRLFDEDGTPAAIADQALELIRAGCIDTLHSFGGITDGRGVRFDRASILRALDWLAARDVRTRVYTNHGTRMDTQNVGGDWADYQRGDVPGDPVYHLDRTFQFGCRFFWTDIDYDNQNAFFTASASAENRLLIPQKGRDGTPILRFRRYRGAFERAPYAGNIAEQIRRVLSQHCKGYAVVYQHLGVQRLPDGTPIANIRPYFDAAGFDALDTLSRLDKDGTLIVTSTERLLMHALLMTARPWRISKKNGNCIVEFEHEIRHEGVNIPLTQFDLCGWSMPLADGMQAIADFGGRQWRLAEWVADGRRYAGIPWERRAQPFSAIELRKLAAKPFGDL
jgi:hypothetical protein